MAHAILCLYRGNQPVNHTIGHIFLVNVMSTLRTVVGSINALLPDMQLSQETSWGQVNPCSATQTRCSILHVHNNCRWYCLVDLWLHERDITHSLASMRGGSCNSTQWRTSDWSTWNSSTKADSVWISGESEVWNQFKTVKITHLCLWAASRSPLPGLDHWTPGS